MKPHYLSNVTLGEISLVDEPANDLARVSLYKMNDGPLKPEETKGLRGLLNFFEAAKAKIKTEKNQPQKGADTMTEEQFKKFQEENDKRFKALEANLEHERAINKMSAGDREMYDSWPDEVKEKFKGMKPEDQKAFMDSKRKEMEAKKSAAKPSPEVEALQKSLEDIRKQAVEATRIAKEETAKREALEYQTKAEKEWPHLKGTPAQKGAFMQHVESASEEVKKFAYQMLKSADSFAKTVATELGVTNSGEAAEEGTIEAYEQGVEKYAKDNKITDLTKAYREYTATPEGARLFKAFNEKHKAAKR